METALIDLGTALHHVAIWLSGGDCVRLACTCAELMSLVRDDAALWRALMSRDYGMDEARGPGMEECPCTRLAYGAWAGAHAPFAPACVPYVKRAAQAWAGVKAFMNRALPGVAPSLRPPASDADIAALEDHMGRAIPPALRVLYSFHDGQELEHDECFDPFGNESMTDDQLREGMDAALATVTDGLFGGYEVYHHLVNVRFLPLRRARKAFDFVNEEDGLGFFEQENSDMQMPGTFKWHIPFAASFNWTKVFAVGATDACMRVTTSTQPILAAPQPEGSVDGVLRWFEAFSLHLQQGHFAATTFPLTATITPARTTLSGLCLFPLAPPTCCQAVTHGVRVRASPLLIPEQSSAGKRSVFAYSIHFFLLSEREQAEAGVAQPLPSCQLRTRSWTIRGPGGDIIDSMSGEGVIGQFPLLRAGDREFVYQSCTVQERRHLPGSMEGSFGFVAGSIQQPTGAQFDVTCPRFELAVPEYIF